MHKEDSIWRPHNLSLVEVAEFYKENKIEIDPITGCWKFLGSPTGQGYGRVRINGREWGLHRLFYTVYKGEIPNDKIVMHTCDNKLCCNPEHLILGTQHDNVLDAVKKGIFLVTRRKDRLKSLVV